MKNRLKKKFVVDENSLKGRLEKKLFVNLRRKKSCQKTSFNRKRIETSPPTLVQIYLSIKIFMENC